jgi:hypothetical protein
MFGHHGDASAFEQSARALHGAARIVAYDRRVHLALVLTALALVACDAGTPAKSAPPPPPIARPIDAAAIIQMDGPRAAIDMPEAFSASRLAPIAALPSDWEHMLSLLKVPALEIGRSNGALILVARERGKLYATTFSPGPYDTLIGSFRGQRSDDGRGAALLVFIQHDQGRHSFAMACGQGHAMGWSCSTPIPLEDADLRSDLIFKLGAEHGDLEIPATAHTPQRRYQITFP